MFMLIIVTVFQQVANKAF